MVTLSIGLLLIGVASVLWLKHQALNSRLHNVESFAADAAKHIVSENGTIVIPRDFYRWIDNTQRRTRLPAQFALTVFDANGRTLFYKGAPRRPGAPVPASDPTFPVPPRLVNQVQVNKVGGMYAITTPILDRETVIGTIAISYVKKELTNIGQQYGLIGSLLLMAGLLGWLIIYWLVRQMSKPIHRVVQAFKQVESGDYKLQLDEHAREQEIHDLLVYFNAMAVRLEQLEQLRTELLAGVTHELQTPITSIRGLTRAVRDQVVNADEADEFLDMSLKETKRLERMVSDLLQFNAYASGIIRLELEPIDLGKRLSEMIAQWSLLHQDDTIEIESEVPGHAIMAQCDADRLQQIVANLLNNSRQALRNRKGGKITIIAKPYSNDYCEVLVKDNGAGIPAEEQQNIFERFYRGSNKRKQVRGLGIGLTLCRMLASAMGGTLSLKETSVQGTTFQLLLPAASESLLMDR